MEHHFNLVNDALFWQQWQHQLQSIDKQMTHSHMHPSSFLVFFLPHININRNYLAFERINQFHIDSEKIKCDWRVQYSQWFVLMNNNQSKLFFFSHFFYSFSIPMFLCTFFFLCSFNKNISFALRYFDLIWFDLSQSRCNTKWTAIKRLMLRIWDGSAKPFLFFFFSYFAL